MSFQPVEELKSIVEHIEGKLPTDLVDYFDEKVAYLRANGIHEMLYANPSPRKEGWTQYIAAEYLLGQFVGIVTKGKENKAYYSSFGLWLKYVYHFIINNVPELPLE